MPNSVTMNPQDPDITQSNAWYERGQPRIPGVTQTLAKGVGQFTEGVAPKFLQRGRGARVWDVDGNEYVDLNMGIGPISLGYAYEAVDAAIAQQLRDGITFSLVHPLEVEVAELLHELIPNAEMVRYGKNGCDVTSAAVRLARAYTGRDKVLCCGYHGWHDWYIGVTDRNAGIPASTQELVHTFEYNNIQHVVDSLDDNTACVILEPTTFVPPKDNFLKELRRVCTERGVVLIFDEMWTGFRLALGGAQEFFDVTPDLATYSKAIANGMPLSALTGRADIMKLCEKDVFFYSTFGGEALSLAAAKATLQEMKAKSFPQEVAKKGQRLQEGYRALVHKHDLTFTKCIGYPSRSLATLDPSVGNPLLMKTFVQQEMLRRGVLWAGSHTLCLTHTDEDIDHVLAAYDEVLPLLAEALRDGTVESQLRGEPLEAVFRRTTNFNVKPKQG